MKTKLGAAKLFNVSNKIVTSQNCVKLDKVQPENC